MLVGIENGDFYAQNIENEVGTSKAEAEKIANETLEKIFIPISNLLEENIKKIYLTKIQTTNKMLILFFLAEIIQVYRRKIT